ncbi:TOBE domain-containing protein, partial [Methylobacterium trifolii]
GAPVVLALRPERIDLVPDGLPATVVDETFLGDRIRRTLRLGDGSLIRISGPAGQGAQMPVGETVGLAFAPETAVILPA